MIRYALPRFLCETDNYSNWILNLLSVRLYMLFGTYNFRGSSCWPSDIVQMYLQREREYGPVKEFMVGEFKRALQLVFLVKYNER